MKASTAKKLLVQRRKFPISDCKFVNLVGQKLIRSLLYQLKEVSKKMAVDKGRKTTQNFLHRIISQVSKWNIVAISRSFAVYTTIKCSKYRGLWRIEERGEASLRNLKILKRSQEGGNIFPKQPPLFIENGTFGKITKLLSCQCSATATTLLNFRHLTWVVNGNRSFCPIGQILSLNF